MRMSQIAKDYGLKVTHINKNNIKRVTQRFEIDITQVKNNAYVFENEHIVLGIYDDYEMKLATFFHEIGHTLVTESFEKLVNHDDMLIEYEAWIRGLKEAKKYGMHFSGKTFKYILKSINSYYKGALGSYNKRNPKWKQKNK